jgi:alkylhydroperoxidase/carboxymuconolactone decarboxylase family protein YurZ
MAVSDTAQRNHDELFPGHVSTLKVTDPELIEIFDNFAFDETLGHIRLDSRTRLTVQLAALTGCQSLSEYRVMLGAALTIGVTPVEAMPEHLSLLLEAPALGPPSIRSSCTRTSPSRTCRRRTPSTASLPRHGHR